VIVQPADVGETVQIIEWARDAGAVLIPYGAGSGVCRGTVAGAGDGGDERPVIIVDLKRMDGIEALKADDGLVRVGAGMIGAPFETELNRRGWTSGHFPSSIYCSSVGGWIAARSAGQCSSRYGKIEDMVASLQVVTGRGEVLETTPELGVAGAADQQVVAGEGWPTTNPTQLFVGNEGTLGLITEATLHIEPAPDEHVYRGFHVPGIGAGLDAIRDIMQSGLRPSVVRLYDPADTLVKGGGTEGAEAQEGGEATSELLYRLLETLPGSIAERLREVVVQGKRRLRGEVLRRLADHPTWMNAVADRLGSDCLLIVGFDGRDRLVKREAEIAFEMARSRGRDLGPDPGENWREHRYDASYKQSPVFEAGTFVDTMEVSAPWSRVESLYSDVRRALGRHALVMAHFSHVYREGSSIYFTFVGGGGDTDESLEIYQRAWRDALDAAADAHGSIAHHHGVGAEKAPWTSADHHGGEALFEDLKDRFDPDRVLNPGKVYPVREES
jgi:alkyldihydroxyacetonephosphate synthase